MVAKVPVEHFSVDPQVGTLDAGDEYMFASTWLQNVPPSYDPGRDGSPCDPDIRWWLEFVGAYRSPDRK